LAAVRRGVGGGLESTGDQQGIPYFVTGKFTVGILSMGSSKLEAVGFLFTTMTEELQVLLNLFSNIRLV
jgi:hypothetical protein